MDFNQLYFLITSNIETILMTTFILLIISLVTLFSINIKLNRLLKKYRKFMSGLDGKNLEEIMLANKEKIDLGEQKISQLERELKEVQQSLTSCIKKVGVVRFNAFPDMGSDLSFSIALLDENENGVVFTGLTGRHDSRTYAKPISGGKSAYHLTDEEKQALKQAFSGKYSERKC